MELSESDKSRTRFHLGLASLTGVPAQDVRTIELAMQTIRDTVIRDYIISALDRCDRAYQLTEMASDPAVSKNLFIGDINRSQINFDLNKGIADFEENYLTEVDRLAHMLHAPNYRRPEIAKYRKEWLDGAYVQPIPGPADTATISKIEAIELISGGSGF